MASSGEAFGSFSGRGTFRLRAAIALAEINIATNQARWNWSLRVENTTGSSQTWDMVSAFASMTIDGGIVYDSRVPSGVFDFRDGAAYHEWVGGTTGWITYSSSGTKQITFVGGVAQAGIFGNAYASTTITADPIPHPPPYGLSVTRVSDTQQTLNWAQNTAYTGMVVHRRVNDGQWIQIGAPGGTPTSFTDTTTAANGKYEYRVIGFANNVQTAWSNSALIYTTPAVPTGVSATRSGNDIVVSASGRPPYATSYDIRDGSTTVATGVALPWTHSGPSATVAHTYTVRAKNGSLTSGYSAASNTVQLLTPPNAPTGLTPNGLIRPSDASVTFTWVHNPVDSSAQTAYELRHRAQGTTTWTTLTGTTATSRAVSLALGTREWEVRTKGSHPDFGAWSATATVTVVTRPGAVVVQPSTSWEASVLPVQWTYTQDQSRPQSSWELELRNAADEVVEARSGTGATTTVTLNRRLSEGSWLIRVRVATGDVWSNWAQAAFTVVFNPPALPDLVGEWDEAQGGVNLTTSPGPSSGSVAATTSIVVERCVDGETWERVVEVTALATFVDWESLSYGDTLYRATAFTVEGATAVTQITVTAASGSVWLSGGVGFALTARLPYDPSVKITAGRQRARKQYAGRSRPVVLTGEALSRVVAVAGTTSDLDPDTAPPQRLEQIAQAAADLHLFRDPDGRRVYGEVPEIPMSRTTSIPHPDGWEGIWGFDFTLTEATR